MDFHYENELKNAPLPVGFIVVAGQQGAGKTSLCTALLKYDYKMHGSMRIKMAQEHVSELNRKYGYKLKLPKNIYFSNIEIALDKTLLDKSSIKTNYINVQSLGLPGGGREVQYLPWGSVIYISEADILLYCQDWQKTSKFVWNLIKYVRQNNMTVLFDLQVFSRLSIQLRKLATDLIYIDSSTYTKPKFFGLIKQKTTWYFNWSKPQKMEAMQELGKLGVKLFAKTGIKIGVKIGVKQSIKDISQRVSFRYKGNVYKSYNSYSGEMYFLQDISTTGYSVKEHPETDFSPSGIDKYCRMLPLAMAEDDKK